MAPTRHSSHGAEAAIAEDVTAFISVLGSTFRDLKSAGPPPENVRAAVEGSGLGKRHIPTLLTVAASGPTSVSDLAARLGTLLSTTSTIVGELSRAGLLERSEDENDRRRTIVRVHSDYSEDLAAWLKLATEPIHSTLVRLSPVARAGFMEGWRILREEAAKPRSSEEQESCA